MMEAVKLGIVGFGFMGHCDADMMTTNPVLMIQTLSKQWNSLTNALKM